jgi:hypothetical protein
VYRLARGSENGYLFDSTSGLTLVNCSDKAYYQDFYLTIDGNQFKILADDYFMSMDTTDDTTGVVTTTCFLGIVSMDALDFWLLGDVFLRGYYSIFDNSDHNAAKIGFAPHATSTKPKVAANSPIPSVGVEDITWELSWVFDMWQALGAHSFSQWYYRWNGKMWVWWFGIN